MQSLSLLLDITNIAVRLTYHLMNQISVNCCSLFNMVGLCVVFSTTVLERKMSMRRPREELIEQGVLKELPENGSVCVCLCAHMSVHAYVLCVF